MPFIKVPDTSRFTLSKAQKFFLEFKSQLRVGSHLSQKYLMHSAKDIMCLLFQSLPEKMVILIIIK